MTPDDRRLDGARPGIPTSVLRLALAASGVAAWATTGVWAAMDSPIVAAVAATLAAATVVVVVVRPQTWLPAAFLVLVIGARISAAPAPSDLTGVGLGICFVMAAVATHSLAGLCAVLSGPGVVELRALVPGGRRFAVVSATASVVMVSASAADQLGETVGVAVAALAAIALIATVAMLSANARR